MCSFFSISTIGYYFAQLRCSALEDIIVQIKKRLKLKKKLAQLMTPNCVTLFPFCFIIGTKILPLKILIFYHICRFLTKFQVLAEIFDFSESFHFCRKFVFLTEFVYFLAIISIIAQILIFHENFDFSRKFRFLAKMSDF